MPDRARGPLPKVERRRKTMTADQFELVVGAVHRAVADAMREAGENAAIAVVDAIVASEYAENLR